MTGRSDSTLSSETLAKVRELDDSAWQKMVDLYYPSVYAWCRQSGIDEHTAADVSQEVFRSVAGGLHHFHRDRSVDSSRKESLGAWIRTITRRRIADHFAATDEPRGFGGTTGQFWIGQIVDPAKQSSDTRSTSANLELRSAVDRVRQEFEPRSWQAFWLVVVQQRPTQEVADSLQMSLNAIYLAKGRIMRRLTELLQPDDDNDDVK